MLVSSTSCVVKGRRNSKQKRRPFIRRPFTMYCSTLIPNYLYRHFDANRRPVFSAIVKMLSHSDSQLLSWNSKDLSVHSQATQLGAPSEVTEDLYQDLQDYYRDSLKSSLARESALPPKFRPPAPKPLPHIHGQPTYHVLTAPTPNPS